MIPLFIFAASMAVYLLTIAPTISFFDSGEMIAGAYTLGVAHPPGYPVYVTLGKLFTFLPIHNVAFRVNLMSAFFASMTSVMVYYITKAALEDDEEHGPEVFRLIRLRTADAAGIFAALAFSFSYNLWAWAVVSKFYTLNAFIVSCILMLLMRWRRARLEEKDRGWGHSLAYLYVIAFIAGIAGVVHISQFVLFPMYLLYVLVVDGSVFVDIRRARSEGVGIGPGLVRYVNLKTIVLMAFFVCLGHSIYLHLPLRASQDPLINWGAATDWRQFKWVYNREGYPVVGGTRTFGLFLKQLGSFDLVREFTWAAIPMILFGLWGHFKKDWRHFTVLLFGSVFMTSVIVIMGNPPEENIFLLEQFYIPVYIFLSVIMGGAVRLVLKGHRAGPWVLALTLPFIFLGELPGAYLKNVFTGARAAAGYFSFMGIRLMPYAWFALFAVFAAIILVALRHFLRQAKPAGRPMVSLVFLALFVLYPAYQLKAHYWKNDRNANFIAYDMGNAELTFSPQFAVLYTWGDSGAFPMWYLQDVERKRPDVLLVHTPHLPLDWFLRSIRRGPSQAGDIGSIERDYKKLRDYNGVKGVEQLLSVPEDFRDPAAMIPEIISFNKERKHTFDYSSRYSITMPDAVFPYGITYRAHEKDYVEQNLRIWRYLVTRGLPKPSLSLDLDETKAVSIYGYIRADLGKKYTDMGLTPLAEQEFVTAVSYAPELWQSLIQYMQPGR
ncbi:MAG TPA: DUF2723 domain-containing protein [Nitrospirota bacterium]|nr:DUF2723 domain-containing protein [Nitrospirota bacterium]